MTKRGVAATPTKATPKRKPALAVESWPIGRPIPYERNPRRISDAAIAKVSASIAAFGFRQPLVVDETGVVIVGHTRLRAARVLGLETVPVHVVTGGSEEQKRAYRLADNRTGEESEWDEELLRIEVADLGDDIDVALTGFDAAELDDTSMEFSDAFGEAPPEVLRNIDELHQLRRAGNQNKAAKQDTEHYLVIVFPDRAAREAQLQRLGLPVDERYVSAAALRLTRRGLGKGRVRADRDLAVSDAGKTGGTG